MTTLFIYFTSAAVVPSVLWRCWLGGTKGIRPVKNWAVGCWHGYLPWVRCRLTYGPAKILTGFTFLVPAHLGSPGKGPLNVCVCCSRCKFQPYDCIVIRFVEWSRFSPLSYFVSRLVWQCDSWSVATRQPQSQEGDWVRAHLCKLARHRPWRVRKRFIRDHVSD